MLIALASAVALSPLYTGSRRADGREARRWSSFSSSSRILWWSSSGFVQPLVLVGLIVAIKAISSERSTGGGGQVLSSLDSSFMLRIGSSSWGLAVVLVMLVLVLSWQRSVQGFFWR
ncbi:hypothetical protein Sjap_011889 [Stephania japonica]|uniref:Uncharacterized protein n=1 Tax=Stephania japonica TaxID=461633 RepID=A0AAP0JEC7_9MAGN